MRPWVFRALAAGVVAIAALLRFPALEQRPMHADEAVLADKAATLIESGKYGYDPAEFHGPALVYGAAAAARIAGARSGASLTERLLRSVPAAAGVLAAVAVLMLAPWFGRGGALCAAALTAVSPAMVYYSRYFIPEMLLVLFCTASIVCGAMYSSGRRLLPVIAGPRLLAPHGFEWAVLTGAAAALAFAAKEAAILALGAASAALFAAGAWRRVRLAHAAAGCVSFLAVLAAAYGAALPAFWSSFSRYAARAASGGAHAHSPAFYFGLVASRPVWAEAVIAALGIAGGIAALREGARSRKMRAAERKSAERDVPGAGVRRFLALYTALLAAVYFAIPYKTPWCMLGFWQGVLVLAGFALAALARWNRIAGPAFAAGLLFASGLQAWRASAALGADPRNPYVYAHTTADVLEMRQAIARIAAAQPEGARTPVQVFGKTNLWPLPWYLREFANVRWWTGVPQAAEPAPVIVAEPALEPALVRLLYESRPPGHRELYVPIFQDLQLRPGVMLNGYAAKSAFDRADATAASPRP